MVRDRRRRTECGEPHVANRLFGDPAAPGCYESNHTGIMVVMVLRMLALAAIILALSPVLSAQGGDAFRNEIRAPLSLEALVEQRTQYSAGIEYNRYFGSRAHDERHRTLFGEPVGTPTSWLQLAFIHQPNTDISALNTGNGGRITYVHYTGSIGVGGSARYNKIRLVDGGEQIDDYEFGPQLAFWAGDRLYITDALLYRSIDGYRNPDLGFNASPEDFFQLRHHLVYAVAEDWSFTYTHNVELLAGIHQNFHTNSFIMNNYFMFSPSTRFSYGPAAGFKLDYRLGSRTSVLVIPVRARAEYFLSNLLVLYGEAGYNIPTMLGQSAGKLSFLASAAYRF
jgi:hypothetical protein